MYPLPLPARSWRAIKTWRVFLSPSKSEQAGGGKIIDTDDSYIKHQTTYINAHGTIPNPGRVTSKCQKAGTKKNNRAPFPSPGGLYDTNCYNTALTERHKTIKNDADASYSSSSNDIIQKAIHYHQKINHHQ